MVKNTDANTPSLDENFLHQANSSKPPSSSSSYPPEEKIITDANAIKLLNHKNMSRILKVLIEEELTIIEIRDKTDLNPGTIKRYLNDLLDAGLVKITREILNKFQINMKYYRTTAQSFVIQWRWNPPNS